MIDREAMVEVGKRLVNDFVASGRMQNGVSVRISSGTSGKEPIVTLVPLESAFKPAVMPWYWNGERMIMAIGLIGLRYHISLGRAMRPDPGAILTVDVTDMDESFTPLAADFAPDAVMATTSLALRLGPLFDRRTAGGIALLRCMGELVTPDAEERLRQFYPNARITSMYICTELGPLTKETCAHRSPRHFHPAPGVTIEAHEPDETGAGDMLVSVDRKTVPIRQYQIGDVVRMLGPCACGEEITFEILGRRGYDYIKLGDSLIVQAECDRVAGLLPKSIDDYRIEASEREIGGKNVGKLVLKVFGKSGVGSPALQDEVARVFSDNLFLSPDKTLADLVRLGEYEPLEVRWEAEPFPMMMKSVRIRRV